jgi:hypothetical protein
MSEQILLLNPRTRRRRKNRMPAALARYWARRRGRSYRARSHNPHRRRRRRHNRRYVARRRGHHYRAHNRRHYHRRRRSNRRRHRNPSVRGLLGRGGGIVKTYATPVILGAVGGAALNFAWGYVSPKLPANLQAGWVGVATKSAVAIGLAMLVGRFVPRYRQQAQLAGLGAVILTAGPPIIGLIGSTVPGLSGYIDYQSYSLPMSRSGMHGYMPRGPGLGGLGDDLYSPAAVIQPPGTPVPRQFGGYIATQPNTLNGYMAAQPHVMGSGGLMGYDWQNDGM